MTDLQFLSVRELGGLLRSKQVSPVELAGFFLDKLESEGPRYNALVAVTRERALKQAKQAEREIASGEYRGPLHGIPYGLKDLVATAGGAPTTWGAVPFQDQTFDYDATIVRKLDAAGAVLVAKLAMVELAGGMGYLHTRRRRPPGRPSPPGATRIPGRADRPAVPAQPWPPGWCRSPSARRPGAPSCSPPTTAALPGCVPPMAG